MSEWAKFSADVNSSYRICILSKFLYLRELKNAYIEPYGLNPDDFLLIKPHFNYQKTNTPVKEMKEYIEGELTEILDDYRVEYLIVTDGNYFKTLTKCKKAEDHIGYVMDSVFGPQKCIYIPSFKNIWRDPKKINNKIRVGIDALKNHMSNNYHSPGTNVIKTAYYPETLEDIEKALDQLSQYPALAMDIETFSLKFNKAGIGTIGFAWDKHSGVAFKVDTGPDTPNIRVRELLLNFFLGYTGKMVWQNIAFDVTVLIYQLFMNHIPDNKGLLKGLKVMLRDWDDTKLITYLATNTCAGNELGLKVQAQEFAGNYAQEDIKDITKIPLGQLLEYNLIDCCATWYVYEKHWDTMVQDEQEKLYNTIFKPSIVDIIQMQLSGLPVNMTRAEEVYQELFTEHSKILSSISKHPLIQQFDEDLRIDKAIEYNETHVKKSKSKDDFEYQFNPNSPPQLQRLLYEEMGLPILERTKTGAPSTGGDVLKMLGSHTNDDSFLELLGLFRRFKDIDKIIGTFLKAIIHDSILGNDGWYYLCGSFNLGGTVSGRLSSSNPNMQNLPAKGDLAKKIKSIFQAPPGYLFVSLDFASLEDRISALTTKDKNKLKVYTDGYDGHCLRAYTYWPEKMPDIDPTDVDSINSIEKKYKDLRGNSKAPTFALTYAGTYATLMKNCGFSESEAKHIENQYHALYKESDEWVKSKLAQASKDGYVTVAFGLRVRTPLLYQTIRDSSKTPHQAEAEGRTAGNALGQSWGLLNNRAMSEVMEKVRNINAGLYIRPGAAIHDAQYYVIKDDVELLEWFNNILVEAVEWNNHPDIYHPEVGLGGELGIFYPSWANEITIPNHATKSQIISIIDEAINA